MTDRISEWVEVYRRDEHLGTARLTATIDQHGRVSGTLMHAEHLKLPPQAGAVPLAFLPIGIEARDLHCRLAGGRIVEFSVPKNDGVLINGRCRDSN